MSPALRDDLWGDSDEDTPQPQQELAREWEARRQRYYNTGYREGLDAGKADTIQQGFDAGFMQGARAGYQYGQLKGALQSLALLGGASVAPQAQQLLDQLSQAPTKRAAADICAALLQQPLEGDAAALARLSAAMQQLLSDGPTPAASQDPGPGSAAAGELALQLQQHMQQQLCSLGHAPAPPPPPSNPVTAAAATAAGAAAAGSAPQSASSPVVQKEEQQEQQQQQPPPEEDRLQEQEVGGAQAQGSPGGAAAAQPCAGCSCQHP